MNSNNVTERLANLSPAKRALLEQRLKEKGADPLAAWTIPRRPSREFAPLSFAQQRLWFLNQLEPESPAYNESRAVRLAGVLDLEALERSLNHMIARHEALRTTIVPVDGNPMQMVADHRTIELPLIDLRGSSAQDREIEAHRLINEAVWRPFDLSRDLMLRVLLLRLDDREHILTLVTHHVASDGWSSAIFWQEVTALYEAYTSGRSPNLRELPVQYADYAAWQREWFRGEVLETQLSYWRKQLHNLATLHLYTDRPRPAIQSFRGAKQTLILPNDLSEALRALSRKEGVTLFMTLLAAFQALLYRYTGQEDIAVGAPIAGRNRAEIEGLIGFFVNTLVLQTNVSDNLTFSELLGRVRGVCLDAYSHQDLPFEKLVEELQPQRNLKHNPLFQVTFQLNNGPRHLVKLPAIEVEDIELESGISKFDLSLSLSDYGKNVAGRLQYNTDLFDDATIARLLAHLQVLLEGIVSHPEQRIADLPILTGAEKHQLLVEWNQTKRDYPKDKCVHQLFEEQVKRTPEAIAVVFEDQELTYGELNSRANQLAHYLKKLGVGSEVLVGICVERSLEMIIGLLGILKAGGTYVPLDPEYPKERLAFMLQDAKARVLLTQRGVLEKLPQYEARVICLDRDWGEISKESEENPNSEIIGENLAYVIYTSGSTGRPKGVAVEHRQLLNYVFSILDRLDLPFPNSFATVSTLGADLGNTVIFSSWCTGASLHVISRDRLSDGEAMAEYFSRHAIDCLKIVPSHLAALQTSSHPENVLPRKLLILGGEASNLKWVNNLQRLASGCAILNHYGPTESTIGVATYRMERDTLPTDLSTVPLGRPLANTQVYLLDQNLNPVPVGVAGELHIGGLNLTRGYLHCPELTAEKFIPNPFGDEPGARLYKTGDRARYLPDGNIEFLGRTDHQVKIRGYRIEPGEIEAALRQNPDVRESVVEVREDERGDKRLIAYVVARPDRAPTVGGKPCYRLPNGAAVAQLNKNETDYIYQEIFERQAYLKHGITIKDGDCIFDVGANIGLFTLFVNQIARRPRVYSFEPNPAVYEILSANATLYGPDARLSNCGLSNRAKRSTFTFFPGFSLLSGFYADAQADKEVVKTFMLNQHKAGISEMAELVEQADAILAERFKPQTFNAELRTVSSVIEQEDIEHIDLLKINVEKSELDVLLGIKESDWQKIKQIVLEVDVKDNLPTIASLLQRHGYEYVVEQDNLLEGTSLCYVYAIRASSDRVLLREQRDGAHIQPIPVLNNPVLSTADLRNFLGNKLPEYMVPSAFMFLEALPLNPNGKVDRNALPAPDQRRPELDGTFSAPRTPIEELLVNIWAEVLKLDRVGIHDNFFELGGHSLLVAQVVSRVRQAFQAEAPVRSLFENPTIAGLADLITLSRAGEAWTKVLPIVAGRIDQQYPLSFSQERFWFLSQLEPDNLAYKVTQAFRLSGPLNIEALEQTLSEIVRRHETLRTTFQPSNGSLIQIISDRWSIQLSILDLTQKTSVDIDREVQRLFEDEHRRPFDLSSDLLLRAALVRLSTDENVLFLSSHHVAWDHWCIQLFWRELSILYQAFANAKPSPLTDLPIQYKHYALWQRKMFQGAELEPHLAYWKKQLAGASPFLALPADHPRKPLHNRQGGRQTLVVSKGLDSALRSLSRNASVTFFMTLLAAFQTLLHRLTGEDDIVVGTPVAGRDRSETEGLIGLFLNSLALRTNLSGNPTFLELLARVREVALGAYDHQELPFEKLVEALQPERDLSRTPFFQVFINMYNFKEISLELDRLCVSPLKGPAAPTPQFDLEFYIRQHDDGVHLVFVYDSDLFESATITRMLGHFQALLEGIVSHPELRISDLPLLTEAERRQLLVEWNDTKRDYPEDACIHQLFEAQAERTPDAVALLFEGQQLSYEQLNARANQLARDLRNLGVGPETLVGLCMERSLESVIGIIAILKAGGVYLPLDPSYPLERLTFLLQDAKPRVVLTLQCWVGRMPQNLVQMICLDKDWTAIALHSSSNLVPFSSPNSIAYLIYTSGSTGVPKGVLGLDRGLVNRLAWMWETWPFQDKEVCCQKTSANFIDSLWEIFGGLLKGIPTVIIPDSIVKNLPALVRTLAEHRVSRIVVVPSLLRSLLDFSPNLDKQLPYLRFWVTSGEVLTKDLARSFLGQMMQRSLINLYGSSEVSADVTWWEVSGNDKESSCVPIGRPIANTLVYILDQHLKPVPVGVAGELYIGGNGLAGGYLHRPELTAEKFIQNPYSSDSSARLYRTGDLARYLPDGNIEFLGRIDDQVKIRGYRIELGEIEEVLGQHPAVREAVVLAREDSPGDRRLVAYLVAGPDPSTSELRSFLKQKLPEFMVPSAFVWLHSLPLTPNGKVDRSALPAPAQSRPELDETFLAPRTPIEELLAGIWAEVLKLDRVGIHDNFFELGGHSLLATRTVSRMREVFRIKLPLRALFEMPTVASLSDHIEAIRWAGDENQLTSKQSLDQTEEIIL